MRTLAGWTGLPMELIASMPAMAYERLIELVIARDPWVVENRGKETL